MNERIIELADKAVEDVSSGPWNISDEFCIKFAHLIVRECAALVKGQPHVDKMMDCNAVIKQHFGIE